MNFTNQKMISYIFFTGCDSYNANSTSGCAEDASDERQTRRIRQHLGPSQVHGQVGSTGLLQGLRSSLRPSRTTHHTHLCVPRTASTEFRLFTTTEAINTREICSCPVGNTVRLLFYRL